MRIAVIGPGALGLLFGGKLAEAGHEVRFLHRDARSAARLGGMFSLEDLAGRAISVEATISGEAEAVLRGADLVLITVKAYQTEPVANKLGQAKLPDKSWVLTLQNGLGHLVPLRKALGSERLLAGTTSQAAQRLGPGRVRHTGHGRTRLAPVSSSAAGGAAARRCAELLTGAGIPTAVAANLPRLLWEKLLVNVGINALTAILGVPNGWLLEDPDALASMERLIDEAVEVAARAGTRLPGADCRARAREVARRTADNRSSMLEDLQRGRPTEIAALNGYVAKLAAEQGGEAPTNLLVTRLVEALARKPRRE
jgi:2-dehydropantoate 2-reductase